VPGNIERERRRARERYERQRAARLERQRKNRKRYGIGLAVLCVLGLAAGLTVAFTGGGSPAPKAASSAKPTATGSATPSSSATPSTSASVAAVAEPAHHCTYTASTAGQVKQVPLPPATPAYTAAYTATINTNLGPININLLNSKATCTVNSFVHLASAGFWDKTQCHRVSNSSGLYMLQCGDPTATATTALSCSSQTVGTGGPGYEFADENLTGATYTAGTVAMANVGRPGTNGSQFFLVFQQTQLPANYTPFGTITKGLDILQNVAKAGTSCTYNAGGGVPKEKVIINSVTVHKS
jgi:peptidyl-prolyl cis-trans isomerase B (cyclophilin B)